MLLIGAATIISSCKKDDELTPAPTPAPTTGGLIVDVVLWEDDSTHFQFVLAGVEVGLATSQTNLDNSVYLQKEMATMQDGGANFGQLKPGNYYYDSYVTTILKVTPDSVYESKDSVYYYGVGQIQIIAGADSTAAIKLAEI